MNDIKIWWISDADRGEYKTELKSVKLPTDLVEMISESQGRPGRGRLWISPKLKDMKIGCSQYWDKAKPYMSHAAGFVFDDDIDVFGEFYIGIVTDLQLNIIESTCCAVTERKPPYPMGTVGKIHGGGLGDFDMPAVVLVDTGHFCGGGDDIKAAINIRQKDSPIYNNEWEVWWIGYEDFVPNEQ